MVILHHMDALNYQLSSIGPHPAGACLNCLTLSLQSTIYVSKILQGLGDIFTHLFSAKEAMDCALNSIPKIPNHRFAQG
jgi:hypothetical protein